MAESCTARNDNEMKALEQQIIILIPRIKKSRSRPCYTNILQLLKREGRELSIEDLKVVIGDMVRKNQIKNIGKEDTESFALVEDGVSDDVDDNFHDEIEENFDFGRENVGALETFIDESLHNTLNGKIKSEIKKALDDFLLLQTPNHYKNTKNQNHQAKQRDYTDELITSLKSEITFL